MSEQDTTQPEIDEVEEQEAGSQEPEAPEAESADEPDWRKDFDPDKAAARIAKVQSENKNLRERLKAAEPKAQAASEHEKKITALEAANLRYEVAFDLGLPKELATRLQGETKDEMLADAEALVKLVGGRAPAQRKPIESLRGGGEPEREPEETDLKKIGARMFNR